MKTTPTKIWNCLLWSDPGRSLSARSIGSAADSRGATGGGCITAAQRKRRPPRRE